MNFGQALQAMRDGKRVKRTSWVNDGIYLWPFWYIPIGCSEICFFEPVSEVGGTIGDSVALGNVFAEDWFICEDGLIVQ